MRNLQEVINESRSKGRAPITFTDDMKDAKKVWGNNSQIAPCSTDFGIGIAYLEEFEAGDARFHADEVEDVMEELFPGYDMRQLSSFDPEDYDVDPTEKVIAVATQEGSVEWYALGNGGSYIMVG